MARNITLLSYLKAAAESKIYKATTVALFTNQATLMSSYVQRIKTFRETTVAPLQK